MSLFDKLLTDPLLLIIYFYQLLTDPLLLIIYFFALLILILIYVVKKTKKNTQRIPFWKRKFFSVFVVIFFIIIVAFQLLNERVSHMQSTGYEAESYGMLGLIGTAVLGFVLVCWIIAFITWLNK